MKKNTFSPIHLVVVFILALTVVSAAPAVAEEKTQEPPDQQEMMKRLQELASPGEHHKHLKYFAGDWDSVSMSYTSPGAEPMISKQSVKVRSIFGGRFNKTYIKGSMGGNPYEVWVFVGYDNFKKEFFTFQVNSMGTGYTVSKGTLAEGGKIRKETGEYTDPFSGQVYKLEFVTTLIDDDNYTYEVFADDSKGGRFKITEITYKRIKK